MIDICPTTDCTGCSACFSICPRHAVTLIPDQEGFLHPQIDQDLCIDCDLCRKACPARQTPSRKDRLPEELFFAAYHRDEDIRMASSSGGAFSALASWMLKQGGYVCAASYDDDFKGVHHVIIRSEEELPRLRTSKYTQSRTGTCFRDILRLLKQGEKVLFAGTPCQTAGLHLFLRKEYDKLLTVDIVCHGVPSPVIFADYISYLERKYKSPVKNYNFRDKKWSWYHFNTKAEFKNRKAVYRGTWEEDTFMRGFLRESCYTCKYSKHERYADITLSDFWGYDASDGGFPNDDHVHVQHGIRQGCFRVGQILSHLVYASTENEPHERRVLPQTGYSERKAGFPGGIPPYRIRPGCAKVHVSRARTR